MRIVVNDANILIDLVELNLLPHFFGLKYRFHTTTLVLDELFEEQQTALKPYINQNLLSVSDLSSTEILEISILQQRKPKLSEQDCSAFYQAISMGGILISSDKNLRKFAQEENLQVHGHFWVFDQMVSAKVITPDRASEKLRELCEEINPRLKLPPQECKKRYRLWSSDNFLGDL